MWSLRSFLSLRSLRCHRLYFSEEPLAGEKIETRWETLIYDVM